MNFTDDADGAKPATARPTADSTSPTMGIAPGLARTIAALNSGALQEKDEDEDKTTPGIKLNSAAKPSQESPPVCAEIFSDFEAAFRQAG